MGKVGHRDRMRDQCLGILILLLRQGECEVGAIADEIGATKKTVRRWLRSYSMKLPIAIDDGVVRVTDPIRLLHVN